MVQGLKDWPQRHPQPGGVPAALHQGRRSQHPGAGWKTGGGARHSEGAGRGVGLDTLGAGLGQAGAPAAKGVAAECGAVAAPQPQQDPAIPSPR